MNRGGKMNNRAVVLLCLLLVLNVCGAPRDVTTKREGEYLVASTRLGTKVTYSGGTWNGGIPLSNLVLEGNAWGPIINPPMAGTYHIKLALPVDLQGVAFWQHKRPGTMQQIRSVDILVNGKVVLENAEIPRDKTQTEFRFELGGITGQEVSLRVKSLYDRTGKEANWGGLDRVRIYSKTDLSAEMSPPDEYQIDVAANAIQPTHDWQAPRTYTVVKNITGNPCLQWDAAELQGMRAELAVNPFMQEQLNRCRQQLSGLLKTPVSIPEAERDQAGKFIHVSDRKKMPDGRTWGKIHNDWSVNALTAAMVWRLTDEAPYAKLAKDILMEYARVYPNYQIGARPGFSHDPAKIFDQCLSDATWLIPIVRGYDLIYDQFTAEERQNLETNVLKDAAQLQARNRSHLQANTNWAVICTASILLTGYATHDDKLVDIAEKGWTDAKGRRSGGYPHQFRTGIGDDMLWKEGAMGYQGMALQGLICMAETLRHHGIDMYAANDGALKKLFDSELLFSYPNNISPAIHDSGLVSIFNWNDTVWEYAYENYRDERYLPVLQGITRWMPTRFQIFVSSTRYQAPAVSPQKSAETAESMNFDSVGYAVMRLRGGDPYLLLDYGPHGSHSHPDKLNIDLFVNGEQLIPDPGSVWYETTPYKEWYRHSFAHNLLIVDELEQTPTAARLLVFDGDESCRRARAVCDSAACGVTQDRALFLTPQYLVDVFGAFSRMEHTYDLVCHLRGTPALPAALAPFTDKLTGDGYRVLTDVRSMSSSDGFTASFTSTGQTFSQLQANVMASFTGGKPGTISRLLIPAGTPTTYFTGYGLQEGQKPTTIFQRRQAKNTVFCTVVDFSGTNYVRNIRMTGGLETGMVTVTVETADGVKNYSVSYRSPEMTNRP